MRCAERLAQIADAVAFQRRDHEGFVEFLARVQRLRQRQQPFAGDEIDLVQHKELGRLGVLKLRQYRVHFFVDPLAGVDEQRDHVGVGRAGERARDHGAIEPPLGLEDARRVDKDDLRRALDGDAANQRPRRLRLARHDRDLGADELIEQRRLAGVGRADQRGEAAARVFSRQFVVAAHVSPFPVAASSRARNAAAAACSATRFEAPDPGAAANPCTSTTTSKKGAWSGPLRATSR